MLCCAKLLRLLLKTALEATSTEKQVYVVDSSVHAPQTRSTTTIGISNGKGYSRHLLKEISNFQQPSPTIHTSERHKHMGGCPLRGASSRVQATHHYRVPDMSHVARLAIHGEVPHARRRNGGGAVRPIVQHRAQQQFVVGVTTRKAVGKVRGLRDVNAPPVRLPVLHAHRRLALPRHVPPVAPRN